MVLPWLVLSGTMPAEAGEAWVGGTELAEEHCWLVRLAGGGWADGRQAVPRRLVGVLLLALQRYYRLGLADRLPRLVAASDPSFAMEGTATVVCLLLLCAGSSCCAQSQ